MTTTSTTSAADASAEAIIDRKLRKAWHKERRFMHTRGLCHLLLWLVAMILVDLVVDWWLTSGKMPGHYRLTLLAVNVGAIGYVLWRNWLRHLRRFDPLRVALQVEKRHPELKSLLVSYVQFSHGTGQAAASESLINALRRQAITATRPMSFREIVSYKDLSRVALFSAAVLLVFGAMNLRAGEFFMTLLHRMLNPTASVAYPTRTHIETVNGLVWPPAQDPALAAWSAASSAPASAPASGPAQAQAERIAKGSFSVPQGATVSVEFACAGLVPQEARLHVKPADGNWERLTIPQTGQKVFTHSFGQVFRSFMYRARIGDAETEDFAITVVPPPHISHSSLDLEFPSYIRSDIGHGNNLNPEVPEGTRLIWHIRTDRPLESAQMLRLDGTKYVPVEMQMERGDRSLWTASTVAGASFPYRFRFVELEHGYAFPDAVEYFVQVAPDAAPQVEVLAPRTGSKATRNYSPTVYFTAGDDHGLGQATLVWQVDAGTPGRAPLDMLEGKSIEKRASWKLSDHVPDIKEGQSLTLTVEVADRSGKSANVGRSSPVKIDIVTEAQFDLWIAERRAQQAQAMQAMLRDEQGSADEIRAIRNPSSQPAESSGESSSSDSPTTAPAGEP
jgi:hypothetical protein